MTRWYALLAVAVLFNGLANVLMKFGMRRAPDFSDATGTIKHYITSWPVIVGLALFAINVIAYTQALTKLPLSVAYPIMVAMTGLIVISGSIVLFREAISWWQWLGFALIIGGVVCVTR
jgi:small multidrug resistance pump